MVDIIETKTLTVSHCNVMNEELLYMFYGKPAYRTRDSASDTITANLPCCLIFSPNLLAPKIKRIFPFDSGGFNAGLYDGYFHRRSTLDQFEFDGDIQNAEKLVSFFFQSNREYYVGRSGKNVDISALQFEAEGLHNLARTPSHPDAPSNHSPDERATAIELQFDSTINLDKNLLAIIIPQIALSDENFRKKIAELDIEHVIPFESMNNFDASQFAAIIYEKVIELYKKLEIIE